MTKLLATLCLVPVIAFGNSAVMTNDAHKVIAKDGTLDFDGVTIHGLATGADFSTITGAPTDNAALNAALLGKAALATALSQFAGGTGAYRVLSVVAADEVDNRLSGLTAGAPAQNLYSSGTTRSTTHLAHDVDLTCISIQTAGAWQAVAISPRHIVTANHISPANGTTVVFVATNGTSISRTLSSSTRIGTTDIQIGLLNSDLPASIVPAKVFASAAQEALIVTGSPIVFVDQAQKLFVGERLTSSESTYSFAVHQSGTSPRSTFWKSGGAIGGDSGGAVGTIIDGHYIAMSEIHTANGSTELGGDSIARNYAAINSAMTSLGGGYQLAPVKSQVLPNFLLGTQSAVANGGNIISANEASTLIDTESGGGALSYNSADRAWTIMANADVDLRAALSLVVGTNVQAYDADLTTWAATTPPNSYAVGDLLYASAVNTLSKLADVATGSVLVSGGVTIAPAWSSAPTFAGTNLTGTASNLTVGHVTTNANLTGDVTSVGNATTLANIPAISGVNITSLNASNLGSGNVPDARNTVSNSTTTTMSALGTIGGLTTVTGTGAMSFTGGAGNMTITSGTGASRTIVLRTTTSGGTATTALTIDGSQIATFANAVVISGTNSFQANSGTGFNLSTFGLRLGSGALFTMSESSNPNVLDAGGMQLTRDSVNGFSVQSAAPSSTFNDPTTAASGTVANRYIFGIAAPTLTATNSSVTDTVASTVYIGGAPTASTNTTITTPYALNVAAGVSNFGGPVIKKGYTVATLPSTAATGMVQGAAAFVTDATAPTYLGALTGGSNVVTPVFYNGSAWVSY